MEVKSEKSCEKTNRENVRVALTSSWPKSLYSRTLFSFTGASPTGVSDWAGGPASFSAIGCDMTTKVRKVPKAKQEYGECHRENPEDGGVEGSPWSGVVEGCSGRMGNRARATKDGSCLFIAFLSETNQRDQPTNITKYSFHTFAFPFRPDVILQRSTHPCYIPTMHFFFPIFFGTSRH